MKILFVINDAPYGSEKAYNAMRLAMTLQSQSDDAEIFVFLLADAVTCALPHQSTPQGYYNLERMLKAVINKGGQVKVCGTCAGARGIKELGLIEGAEITTMSQLAQWVAESDRVLTF
jgi:uncharacterized protein involved in oxidation of intracellular sulfur